MDVACSLEPVTRMNSGGDKIVEILPNTGQLLSSSIKDSDISPKNMGEVVPNAENIPVNSTTLSSPNGLCDLNSNIQQRAKTKGALRQQLHMKRQQIISNSVAVASSDISTDNCNKKKTVSPDRAASQVNCYHIC